MRRNTVKAAWAAGRIPVGTMVLEFDTTGIARIAKAAGVEWVVYDMEHSGWSISQIRAAVAGAHAAGVVPVVRPPALQYHLCAGPLDVGAMGIMAPMVETVAQAELLVSSCRYPPLGRRGAAFGIAHDDYLAPSPAATVQSANAEVLTIAMIETPLGVENAAAIAAVDGLDALWLGHYDLSNFMGIPGQFDDPRFVEAVGVVVAAGRRAGKPVGILVGSVEEARTRLAQGFTGLLYGLDVLVYREALAAGVAAVRDLIDDARPVPAPGGPDHAEGA